ncbi:MAG: biotin transporter BioY [Candidatus Riflebacteria bacterium]|nr:biotin transporter BioY [Candidatus Riflebacteria bacterium]
MNTKSLSFPVFADVFPASRGLVRDIALIILGSIIVALSARLEIPFVPVSVTGQTFGVLLVGILLGKERGAASLIMYIAEGCLGLPVFAGGAAGFAHLMGPTGGYLIGMVAAAWITGAFAEMGWDRRCTTTAAAMLFGNIAIYVFGLPWLAKFTGWKCVMSAGLIPFIPGDLVKLIIAALIIPRGWNLLSKLNQQKI